MKYKILITVNRGFGSDLYQNVELTELDFLTMCAILSAARDLAWMDGAKVDGKEEPK